MRMVQDGVDVYCLPDNAYCGADEEKEVHWILMIALSVAKRVREIVITITLKRDLSMFNFFSF